MFIDFELGVLSGRSRVSLVWVLYVRVFVEKIFVVIREVLFFFYVIKR